VVFLGACAGCALATTLHQLVFWRVVQGLCAGAGMVVGRAMIRDVFEGHDAQRLMSMVTMIFGLAPAIAPVVGGVLHQAYGWRSHFVFLAIFSFVLLVVCWRRLPETLPPSQRQPFAVAPLAAAYRRVGADTRFLLLSTAVALNFCGFFVYVVSAPAFVYEILGLAETEFAWLFVPGISGVVLGAWLSGRLAGRITPRATVRIGYTIMFAAVVVNVAGNLAFTPAIPWAVLPVMFYTVGMSLAMPSVSLIGLDLFPHNRGMASSLQGFEHSAATAILAGAVAPLVAGSGLTMAIGAALMLVAGWLCWMAYLGVEAGRRKEGRT
jgi:DHA1 family bicyclomycin/chloramphenicol resistance-like MFS transporter